MRRMATAAAWAALLCTAVVALQIGGGAASSDATRPSPAIAMGAASIRAAVGDRAAQVAAASGLTLKQFNRATTDPDFVYSLKTDRVFYACSGLVVANTTAAQGKALAAVRAMAAAAPSVANASDSDPIDTSKAFKLHSRPGAPRFLLLDFTGHVTKGTAWNVDYGPTLTSPPFDLDGNLASFSQRELQAVIAVWRGVAADYAAFDVDVTTEEVDAQGRPLDLKNVGARVVIGGNSMDMFRVMIGGVARMNGFGDPYYNPAFVFPAQMAYQVKNIIEATSHELGHTLGLQHHGTPTSAYFEGISMGNGYGWAPIMGTGYYQQMTTWCNGEYTGERNQDDVAVIDRTLPIRADDHGNDLASATPLKPAPLSGTRLVASAAGNIERASDVDWFAFRAGDGLFAVTLTLVSDINGNLRTNLDAKVELRSKASAEPYQVANANNGVLRGQIISMTIPGSTGPAAAPGNQYYLSVTGTSDGPNPISGYSNYGSLGEYVISVEYETPPAPTCDPGFVVQYGDCVDADECASGAAQCAAEATCTNTPGSYVCTCPAGYSTSDSGRTCTDINECTSGAAKCDALATCANTKGNYTCTCPSGYSSPDGRKCQDINECAPGGGGTCDKVAKCTNTLGSYNCTCPSGYTTTDNGRTCQATGDTCVPNPCSPNAACFASGAKFWCFCNYGFAGDGFTCTDVDECTEGTNFCDANALCTNTVGNYTCTCKNGYEGDGFLCKPASGICSAAANVCSANARCSMVAGQVACQCAEGYTGDGKTCTDIDECTSGTHNCSADATCTNTGGGFTCACRQGFTGNGYNCTDINECATSNGGCDANALCINTPGGFTCACKSGFEGNGTTCTPAKLCGADYCDPNAACNEAGGQATCKCKAGFLGSGWYCGDVDDCLEGTHNCSFAATCKNTIGGYTCSCKAGYTGDGYTCTDINECADPAMYKCAANADCINTYGGYTCACKSGFEGTGHVSCTDVDECARNTAACAPGLSTCKNTVGGYNCTCKAGYSGDGFTCLDINECTAGTHKCSPYATCKNTNGSFTCTCLPGFTGNGYTCIDINECLRNNGGCSPSAKCNNTLGNRTCACNVGYRGNGFTCTDINECLEGTHLCAKDIATCTNTVGNYLCACKPGYSGNGFNCTDINECKITGTGAAKCPANSACVNTVGNYTCICLPGFGSAACAACSPGTVSPGGSLNPCVACPPRTQPNATRSGCTVCTTGAGPPGVCDQCLGGYGGLNCTNCTGNSYSVGGSLNACTSCPARQKPNAQRTGCDCIASAGPAGVCDQCLRGYGGTNCTLCTPTTYSPGGSLDPCKSCPANQVPNPQRTGCICRIGFGPPDLCNACAGGYGGATCQKCGTNTYSPGGSFASCLPCASPKVTDAARTTCTLPAPRIG